MNKSHGELNRTKICKGLSLLTDRQNRTTSQYVITMHQALYLKTTLFNVTLGHSSDQGLIIANNTCRRPLHHRVVILIIAPIRRVDFVGFNVPLNTTPAGNM